MKISTTSMSYRHSFLNKSLSLLHEGHIPLKQFRHVIKQQSFADILQVCKTSIPLEIQIVFAFFPLA